jgi:phage terminase large subunit GpA-like protein
MGARDIPTTADAAAIVEAIFHEFLAPPPVLTVTEWAEANRILSGKDSSEPGPYRVARTPYAREPMDCLSATSPVEEVVLMWGAQTSKTTIGGNWLGYNIDINPGPGMIVQPTKDMARRYSRQRLAPMIEESPRLRGKVSENKSRDSANTMLLKDFPGGFAAIAGANSAADLRSMPVRDLFLDEIDGYPPDVDGEGDPCQLAEARQSTFARRKRLKTSTPTTKDFSRIETAYLASDRCRYHVPCPHCGEFQHLEWGADLPHGIKWRKHEEDGTPDPSTVHYLCKHCAAEIPEHHKPAMLAAGKWVADLPGAAAGRVRGFQLNSLYSPLGWLSWAKIVAEWSTAVAAMRAGGDDTLLRVFVNTRLAETYEVRGDFVATHELQKRAEDWPLRTCPWGVLLTLEGCDVQGDRIEAYRWGYGRGNERWLVDHVVLYGDPSIPEQQPGSPWALLTEWRHTPLRHAGGANIRARACAVDSGGHHAQQVYLYARRWATEHVLAVKGSSQAARPILGKPTDIDINHKGQRLKGARLWMVGTDTAKGVIYGLLRNPNPGPGYVHTSKATPGYVYEQLTAERLVPRYFKGRPRLEWVKPASKRNEALDCAVYAEAAAHYVGVPRYREADWQRLDWRLRQTALLDPETGAPQTPLPLDTQGATIHAVAPEDSTPTSQAPDAPEQPAQEPPAQPASQPSPPTLPEPPPRQGSKPAPPLRRGRSGFVKKW